MKFLITISAPTIAHALENKSRRKSRGEEATETTNTVAGAVIRPILKKPSEHVGFPMDDEKSGFQTFSEFLFNFYIFSVRFKEHAGQLVFKNL
jgi:hypothetical protein